MSDPNPGAATSDASPEASAPPPARFDTLPLDEKLLRAVADSGYQTMTPIQAKAIPIVLAGRDVMGAAQTGTGKTAAFSIPLLQKMLRHENPSMSPARHPVRALVLAPTRELADQGLVFVVSHCPAIARWAVHVVALRRSPMTEVRITTRLHGPLLVQGPAKLCDHEGNEYNLAGKETYALCRCDKSQKRPFCDGISA